MILNFWSSCLYLWVLRFQSCAIVPSLVIVEYETWSFVRMRQACYPESQVQLQSLLLSTLIGLSEWGSSQACIRLCFSQSWALRLPWTRGLWAIAIYAIWGKSFRACWKSCCVPSESCFHGGVTEEPPSFWVPGEHLGQRPSHHSQHKMETSEKQEINLVCAPWLSTGNAGYHGITGPP